ncbi:MAG: hypothetical protein AAFQ88_06010 [Pseudomonadota bacterium]
MPIEIPLAKVRERGHRLLPTARRCRGRSAEAPETLYCIGHRQPPPSPLHRIRNVVVVLWARWVGLATVRLAAEEIMVTVRRAILARDEVLAAHSRGC